MAFISFHSIAVSGNDIDCFLIIFNIKVGFKSIYIISILGAHKCHDRCLKSEKNFGDTDKVMKFKIAQQSIYKRNNKYVCEMLMHINLYFISTNSIETDNLATAVSL